MWPLAVAFAVFQPSSRGACDRYYLFAIGCVLGLYWLFDAEGQIKDAASSAGMSAKYYLLLLFLGAWFCGIDICHLNFGNERW